MSKAVWGPITWNFLHTVAAKIRPEHFNTQRNDIIYLIRNLCDILPCPECRAHALQNISRANFSRIMTKEDLITFLFEFHNIVNTQTRKQQQPRTILEKYEKNVFSSVINEFASVYSSSSNVSKLMNDSFRRGMFLKWLRRYLIANGKCYNA